MGKALKHWFSRCCSCRSTPRAPPRSSALLDGETKRNQFWSPSPSGEPRPIAATMAAYAEQTGACECAHIYCHRGGVSGGGWVKLCKPRRCRWQPTEEEGGRDLELNGRDRNRALHGAMAS